MVDETLDESKRQQMAMLFRFVNNEGFIKHFFMSFMSLTLLHHYGGESNGLKALILNKCTYTYYVHCMAHHTTTRHVGLYGFKHRDPSVIVMLALARQKKHHELLHQENYRTDTFFTQHFGFDAPNSYSADRSNAALQGLEAPIICHVIMWYDDNYIVPCRCITI
jgi:hypothetical protein